MRSSWGPRLEQGDSLDMMLSVGTDHTVTLDLARNGVNLGRAFDITGWSEGTALRPVVSLAGRGDSVSLTKLTRETAQHFTQSQEQEEELGINGDGGQLYSLLHQVQ